jgi:hypothetical protein
MEERFNLPLIITENGMSNCDWVALMAESMTVLASTISIAIFGLCARRSRGRGCLAISVVHHGQLRMGRRL